MNTIYRFIEKTSKMTFPEKKDILCKNNIVIIRNFEIKFYDKNYYNYNNVTVIYIIYERSIRFLKIKKLFEFSDFQKMF